LVRWPESCHRRILEKRADLGLPRRRERQRWLQSSYLRAENTAGRFARSESPVLTRPVVHVALTSQPHIQDVLTVDAEGLKNLPEGIDGSRFQWVDLNGEGASGILADWGGGWGYKANLIPANRRTQPDGSVKGPSGISIFPIEKRLLPMFSSKIAFTLRSVISSVISRSYAYSSPSNSHENMIQSVWACTTFLTTACLDEGVECQPSPFT
jgi:hypothetical protein